MEKIQLSRWVKAALDNMPEDQLFELKLNQLNIGGDYTTNDIIEFLRTGKLVQPHIIAIMVSEKEKLNGNLF